MSADLSDTYIRYDGLFHGEYGLHTGQVYHQMHGEFLPGMSGGDYPA